MKPIWHIHATKMSPERDQKTKNIYNLEEVSQLKPIEVHKGNLWNM